METAARYLETIESLMIENSRLTKELGEVVKGKLPSRIIPEEEAEKCFNLISKYLSKVASGSLFGEISVLCSELEKIGHEYIKCSSQVKAFEKENAAITQAVSGDDIDPNYNATALVNKVMRLRAVLEVIKARLDRMCASEPGANKPEANSEVYDLRKDVATFLSGDKNG